MQKSCVDSYASEEGWGEGIQKCAIHDRLQYMIKFEQAKYKSK